MRIPQTDMRFDLYDLLDYEGHYRRLGLSDTVNGELLNAILDEATRFAENELAPINRSGDEQGCCFHGGRVGTPAGFKAAYRTYTEGGWAGISGDVNYGGQGLPHSVSLIVEEMFCCGNMAWTMYPGLSRSAMAAIESHGTDEQKEQFLTRLLSGEWTGTMCLTEPHCGSDVGLLTTRAVPGADGRYAITGTKIFISAGEHDLAENIVHLVLARTPDAPPGTRGISLFLVPKFDLDGTRNGVTCGSIEEKMGIHGNATCVMHFEDAVGYRVGEENKGMGYMFTMMNAARIGVGLQGLCLAECAFQDSLAYAQERLQMRSLSGPKAPDRKADPIIVHPDVRRMLLTQKAIIEGGRALVYYAGQLLDTSTLAPEAAEREAALDELEFLTPIIKGCLTELGFESVNHAVQIYGGHGFIRENGVEQYVRDSRITLLYEGTTQIQALDLLARKVLMARGKGLLAFLAKVNELVEQAGETVPEHAATLKSMADEWGALTLAIGGKAQENAEELGAAAVDYLMYSGYCVLAYFWALTAHKAAQRDDAGDDYIAGKRLAADFYFKRLLPRCAAHKLAIEAGGECLMSVPTEAFAHV